MVSIRILQKSQLFTKFQQENLAKSEPKIDLRLGEIWHCDRFGELEPEKKSGIQRFCMKRVIIRSTVPI